MWPLTPLPVGHLQKQQNVINIINVWGTPLDTYVSYLSVISVYTSTGTSPGRKWNQYPQHACHEICSSPSAIGPV